MRKISRLYCRQYESGAVLLTVLTIVLLVSLLALFSTKGTILQEKMTQAVLVQNHTLQAAESGVLQAEHWLAAHPKPTFKVVTQKYAVDSIIEECEAGLCAMSVPYTNGKTHFWAHAEFWENCVAKNQCMEGDAVGQWKIKPRYVIEDYGYNNDSSARSLMSRTSVKQPGTKLMRITAWAELAGSHSIVQSVVQH